MALSQVTYTGDGSTTNRNVPFAYLDTDDVFVAVNGVDTAFTWVTSSTVSISPAPINGSTIVIYRNTPRTAPVAVLSDGAVNVAAPYNNIAKQMLYSVQEIEDAFGTVGEIAVGAGDVDGPASSVHEQPAVFNGTTGKLLKEITYSAFKTLLGLVKGDVGLGNVTNTSDADKPVSTAQQTALDLKAPLASPTFTGTVTVPNASFSLAKLANMATASLYYRKTGGSGAPEVNSLATLKTDLGLTGTNSGDQTITLTGDVTGSGTGSFAATIANAVVTYAKMATAALATAAEYYAATASKLLTAADVWGANGVLTDGATIAVDLNTGIDFGGAANAVLSLGGNRTLGAPTNAKNMQKGILWFGATGSTRTLTLNAAWNMIATVETGPYSIGTSNILGICYAVRGTTVYVTAILWR